MFVRSFLSALIAASLMLASVGSSQAADHLDAPALQVAGQSQRDINDIYAFQSPTNPNNSVLILTVNPFAGVVDPLGIKTSTTTFGTDVVYQFNIDNDGDNSNGPEVTFATTFGLATAGGQAFTTTRNGVAYVAGTSGGPVATSVGGAQGTAGLFDDPFFFDFVGFLDLQASIANGTPDTSVFVNGNTFAGANVSAIVLEVPNSDLNGATGNIGVWATTSVGGVQVDRMGRPGINTVLIASGRKNDFNDGAPATDDASFAAEVNAAIASLPGSDQANADTLTPILIPDVLTYDTSNAGGFLNGRGLADDVIDAELGLLTGGALTSDNVANDSPFLNTFPYLAPANAAVPEPASLALLAMGISAIGLGHRRKVA